MLTFSQAKSSYELKQVSAVCSSSDEFKSLLNQAARDLMDTGNPWNTTRRMQFCTYGNCITFPRFVGTVLALNTCENTVQPSNKWYSFLPFSLSDWGPGGFQFENGCVVGNIALEMDGTTSVFQNVPCGTSYYVRAYARYRPDIGKTIAIFGTDSNGQTIRTRDSSGNWSDGTTLALTSTYASTSFKVQNIERVIKDSTQGVVMLYFYDATNDVLKDCAEYQPSETLPEYRHAVIRGRGQVSDCSSSNCNGLTQVQALVKLEFIPVVNDNDLVLIDNLSALQDMMFAIREKTSGDIGRSQALEASAIRRLNLQLSNKVPYDQIPIGIDSFGSALPAYHSVGRIV